MSSLSKEGIPDYVLRVYRSKFFVLPWQSFLPTLHNMELMQEVCSSLVTYRFSLLASVYHLLCYLGDFVYASRLIHTPFYNPMILNLL